MRNSSRENKGDIDMHTTVVMPLKNMDFSRPNFRICISEMNTRSQSKLEKSSIRDEIKHCSIKKEMRILLSLLIKYEAGIDTIGIAKKKAIE